MADSRNPRRMLYILVILLAVAAVAVSFVKINFFGFSLSDRAAFFYQVDGNITLEPSGDEPVRISLAVPEPDAGWAFGLDPDSRTRLKRAAYRAATAWCRRRSGSCRLFLRRKTPGKHWLRIR